MSNQLTNVGQIAINAVDLDRAVAFYRDVLQLPFLFQIPGAAFFMCGSVRLMLTIASAPEFDHPASIIYYEVDDIQAASATLKAEDVAFEQEPNLVHKTDTMELWMAFFRDTEGNLLAMMSEVAIS